MNDLSTYLAWLTKLRVDIRTVDGVRLESPYKPALLLAVLEGVEGQIIRDNRIEITPELITAFKAYCQLLSPGPEYAASPFQLPFSHLQSSGFWHLRDVIAYVSVDVALWDLLMQPVAREEIRQALLVRYFSLTRHYF
jgi:putative restriction endonuclease